MNRTRRFIWFFITIALGLALGIYFGWFSSPQNLNTASLSDLRSDYQADYVLMVAEIYQGNGDLVEANQYLNELGDQPALRYVQQAIITAESFGYAREDIDLLAQLARAFQEVVQP